jgi:hypothetical protein
MISHCAAGHLLFKIKGPCPFKFKRKFFQLLNTLFLGLISNCDGLCKFLVVASRHNECKGSISVAEPHHFYAAPGENFDAAPAPAPTLLYSKAKFLKRTKVYTHVETMLFI